MSPQVLQRISVRWYPEPAYEDTDTIALNIDRYFLDLRVAKVDGSLQWSRAGERRIVKEEPFTYQWTRIIDSTNTHDPDEATWDWHKLGNGDAFEAGIAHCPHKNGALTSYEEVWRDVTSEGPTATSWILKSVDGTTFLGSVGGTYLGLRSDPGGNFSVRREDWDTGNGVWSTRFESGYHEDILKAEAVSSLLTGAAEIWPEGAKVTLAGVSYNVLVYESTI